MTPLLGEQADDELARRIVQAMPLVLRVCQANLSHPCDIEDAVQETFVQFVQADRTRIANHETWLRVVATRICARIHRLRCDEPSVSIVDDQRCVSEGERVDDILHTLFLDGLLARLPKVDRYILLNLYYLESSPATVAESLGVTTDHLRVMASRARRRALRLRTEVDPGLELLNLIDQSDTST